MSGATDRFGDARVLGLHPEPRRFPEGTKTAADAVAVLALTAGSNRVDEAKLAAAAGAHVARRATPEEARSATGFAVGGTPPFGHPNRLRAFCDEDLLAYDEVLAAAGTPDSVFPLTPADLVRVSGATVIDLAAR